jgi:pyridoxamine 5'-phosphate oxidase
MEAEDLTLESAEHQAWTLLRRGSADRRHGFHHPVVATIGDQGQPSARVVILRAASPEERTLRFHTDARTPKWQDLHKDSRIALCFYDHGARTQVRITGKATLHVQDDQATKAWGGSQSMSRVCYSINPAPGTVLTEPSGYTLPGAPEEAAAGFVNFTAVVIAVETLDWLFLQQARNRRAMFDYPNDTRSWLAP